MFQKPCSDISEIITLQFVAIYPVLFRKNVLKRFLKYFRFCLKVSKKHFKKYSSNVLQILHEIFQIRFLLRNWKCYVKYFWNDSGKRFWDDQNGESQIFRATFQKPCSQISGIITRQFVASFPVYFLKRFEKVFEIFSVLFKGIQKFIQQIFLQRFANFTRNLSDKISVEKLEMLPEIFLKWFWNGSLSRSKRRVPNISSNVPKILQSDLRDYYTTISRILSSIISCKVLKRFLKYF